MPRPRFTLMRLSDVLDAEPSAADRGVSKVARSRRGFVKAYTDANGRWGALSEDWQRKRDGFVARHRTQALNANEGWWQDDGGPTRRHLALMMWAYTPTPSRTERWLDDLYA